VAMHAPTIADRDNTFAVDHDSSRNCNINRALVPYALNGSLSATGEYIAKANRSLCARSSMVEHRTLEINKSLAVGTLH